MNNSSQDKRRELHTLVGRAGSGKTTLLRILLSRSPRALVFDPLGNFYPGIILRDRDELISYLCREPDNFKILYRPSIDLAEKQAIEDEANFICRASRALGPCEVFFDEMDSFCSSSDIPKELDLLTRYGRNIEVTLRAAVRRPKAVVPKHYITETTRFSIFRVRDPDDLGLLEEYTRIPARRIWELQELQYLDWCEGEVTVQQLSFHGQELPTSEKIASVSLQDGSYQ